MDHKIFEILERSLTNISQNYIDEYVKENADFRSKSGLTAKVIRSTNGKCCKWCDKLAGVYTYPVPKEVYQRHDNCDCKVTYVSEKGAQDVYTKKRINNAEFEERLKLLKESEITIPKELEDVKQEYFKSASRKIGKVTVEENVRKKYEKEAIKSAQVLSEFFGDEIIVLEESKINNVKNPDYLWRGKHWEQKKVSSVAAVDTALRNAMKQIEENPGGVVLDISDANGTLNDIYAIIANRVRRRMYDDTIDIILIEKGKIISILRHKKR